MPGSHSQHHEHGCGVCSGLRRWTSSAGWRHGHSKTARAWDTLGHGALPAGPAAFLCSKPQAGTPSPVLCCNGSFSLLSLSHPLLSTGKWQNQGMSGWDFSIPQPQLT